MYIVKYDDFLTTIDDTKDLFKFVNALEEQGKWYSVETDEGNKVRPPYYGWKNESFKHTRWRV